MAKELSPHFAAKLAQQIYVAQVADSADTFEEEMDNELAGAFTVDSEVIKMKTGISRNVGSAMVFHRSGDKREKVVAIRGTEMVSTDWLTNLNIGMVTGTNGLPTHAGFHKTFLSMIGDIAKAVGEKPSHVHVVGHSLGGALATNVACKLAADMPCSVYTFGAPRVGNADFSRDVTSKLEGRVFRGYDLADPVPMIPFYPFTHTPIPGDGYIIGGGRGLIDPMRHMMTNYRNFIEDSDTWDTLRTDFGDSKLGYGVEEWLGLAGQHSRIPGAAMGLWALGKALDGILIAAASIGNLGHLGGKALVGFAMSIPDKIAWALTKALEISGKVADWAMRWIQTAMGWLGRTVVDSAEKITASFLRFVLNLFVRSIGTLARQALEKIRRNITA